MAACLYAAFAHGAVASADEERLQIALAVIALAGALAWGGRRLSLRAPGRVWVALGLLAAFAFWSGVTVLWSVAPDRAWTECNRVMTYALVLAPAIALGASLKRSAARVADGLLLVGLNSHPLTATGVALSTRETAGAELLVVLAACLALMLTGAQRLIALERRRSLSSAQTRRIARGLLGVSAVAIVAAIIAAAGSSRGLTGTVSHAWSSFSATRTTSITNPSRLLSADAENRWVWWTEAARAFGDRPIQGWGAGSFAVVHLRYRRDRLTVQQPHSLPLQLLSETGLVGAGLGLGSLALLLCAGVAAVRRRDPRLAGATAALLGVGTAFCVHALYDWDWDIPAVTLPALIALGVLGAGASARPRADAERRSRRGAASAARACRRWRWPRSALPPSPPR